MNVEAAAIYGGIGAAGAVIGWIVRGTRAWTGVEKDLQAIQKSHFNLKDKFIEHKDDRDIHVDPRRDSDSLLGLKEMITSNFSAMNIRLDRIDGRCEKRGEMCSEHFSRVEQRISAATGRTNGGKE